MPPLRHLALAISAAALVIYAAGSAPERIVSLSPTTTEILYGIGAFPRVVGVSAYCSYPPEASKVPHVGGSQTNNIESILSVHPDLVVLTAMQKPFISDRLRQFGLRSLAVPSGTLADVFTAIQEIGAVTGDLRQAMDLIGRMHASLDSIRDATKALAHPSVLLCVSRTPGTLNELYVATPGSYLLELIEIAGGRSAAAPTPIGYAKFSQEAILTSNPDIIIDVTSHSNSKLGGDPKEAWKDLPELRAVRDNHVYSLNDPFVVHPSQFITHTAELFEQILHPELAAHAGTK
ncbi:MAG: ABC transporter substrate-binding protein [Acidobacteriaceae bacterium]|nr:ABC transporter substrate-binding protein [Acidobacteriaceae bacterium]